MYSVSEHIFSLSTCMIRNAVYIALQNATEELQTIADRSDESAAAVKAAIDAIWYQ